MNPRVGLRDSAKPEPASEPLGSDPASMRANVLEASGRRSQLRQRAGRLTSLPPEIVNGQTQLEKPKRDRSRSAERAQAERVANRKAEREKLAIYTMREPCLKCGVRADIGCKHRGR